MDTVSLGELAQALGVVTSPIVLLWILAGVMIGLIFGAAPGLTATAGVAIVTPLTYGLGFQAAMSLLLGIYCGGYFAGSMPAILVNTPGAPGNAATVLDGYAMARKGQANLALSLAVVSSFIGGIASGLVLLMLAPALSNVALKFTAVEYASFGLFGLICVASISGGSLLRGGISGCLGLLLGTVGLDPVAGATSRLTFGLSELMTGVPLMAALIAFFAVSEMLSQGGATHEMQKLPPQQKSSFRDLIPVYIRNRWVVLRSIVIGTCIGILPGTGPTVASWIAYSDVARSRNPPDEPPLGQGAPRGIIAPEVANNAVTGGATIPLLTLGIPGDTVTAVLLGALMIQNITPGPFFIIENGHLFAQIIIILMFSNLFMLILGLGARRILPAILKFPPYILLPAIGVLAATGGFADSNSAFQVGLIGFLGVAGYFAAQLGLPMPPLVLGLVLCPIIEKNLRDAILVHDGNFFVFLTRPISAAILVASALTLFLVIKNQARSSNS